MTTRKPTGYVIYRGPSLLDGAPIAVIAIVKSSNRKTGNMVQTYILRSDIEPHKAIKTGEDASICGDCKHRPFNGGACYVLTFQGPLVVYRAFRRGRYPDATPAEVAQLIAGRMVRLGTYGDPMAAPYQAWRDLTALASGRTGYSHQWDNPCIPARQWRGVMDLCMASVDNPHEATAARTQGLRYFRIRRADEPVSQREFICPASHEAGKRKTCTQCGACDGGEPHKASPVIIAHGSRASAF